MELSWRSCLLHTSQDLRSPSPGDEAPPSSDLLFYSNGLNPRIQVDHGKYEGQEPAFTVETPNISVRRCAISLLLTKQQCTRGWGNSQALMACGCWWKGCRNGPQFGNLVCKRREGRVSCGDSVPHVWGMKRSADWFVADLGRSILFRREADSHSRKRFKRNKVLFWNSDVQKSSPYECLTNHMANGAYLLPRLISTNSPWPTLQTRQDWVFYKRQSNAVYSQYSHLTAFTERNWSSIS